MFLLIILRCHFRYSPILAVCIAWSFSTLSVSICKKKEIYYKLVLLNIPKKALGKQLEGLSLTDNAYICGGF